MSLIYKLYKQQQNYRLFFFCYKTHSSQFSNTVMLATHITGEIKAGIFDQKMRAWGHALITAAFLTSESHLPSPKGWGQSCVIGLKSPFHSESDTAQIQQDIHTPTVQHLMGIPHLHICPAPFGWMVPKGSRQTSKIQIPPELLF